MKKNKIFAFIFARSGSKGIKNKNIKNFNGAPLVDYTIKFAKKSKIFDKIILSSDSNRIIKSGKKNNVECPETSLTVYIVGGRCC